MKFLLKSAGAALIVPLLILLIPSSVAKDNSSSLRMWSHDSPSVCPAPFIDVDSSKWVGKQMRHILSATFPKGTDKQKLSYKWTISPGTITSGQGCSSITVDMPTCQCDFSVQVEIENLEAGCKNSAGVSMSDLCFYSIGLVGYGDISLEDEKSRLSGFGERLKNEPCSQMDIVVYSKEG